MADVENFDIISDIGTGADTDTIPAEKGNIDPSRIERSTPAKTEAPAQDKAVTLRDQISSALKSEDATPPAAQQDGGPVRNPDGTFAAKQVPVDPNAAAPIVNTQHINAPVGLTPQDAELFAKLPAELQSTFARTMESLNEKTARYSGYEQMEQMIAPRRQAWALNGLTETQAINQLLALSDFASQRPAEFVQYFAQQRGLDLEEILYGADPVDPNVQQLQQQVTQLTQQLNGMNTQQQQAAHDSVVNEIVSFAEEKDDTGQPLRPYLDELGSNVLPFVQSVMQAHPEWSRQQILQEAYDNACWGTPSIRAKMQQASNAAAEAGRIQQQQENAKRARAAGVSMPSGVPTATNTDPSTSANRSLRDEIRAQVSAAR
ncbi:MAG: hypothetical protein E6Q97_32460 [Desulfurellales bacterium]|nr:MAG: hypothetical protein E6Q97_32460 [Desulfurellales bacterium]